MINPSDDQNIPGLDDLLDSIRGKSGALAVYVPDEREEDLVSEEIDERILTLLGLEDAIDIDYATYKTLLREKMMEGRMADSKMPTEETEILTEEFKRVKGNTGRFKVKKEKIKFESFVDNVTTPQSSRPQSSLLALPGTVEPDVEVGQDPAVGGIKKFLGGVTDKLAKIESNLSDMLDIAAEELSIQKEEENDNRVAAEKAKKRDKESGLEKSVKGFGKKVTEKVTKPLKSIFDTILDFFKNIFLGNAIQKLIEFLEDPLLILNPLIDMVNGVIGVVNNILEFLLGGLVENLNKMIPFINDGIGGLESAINNVMGMFAGEEGIDDEEKFKIPRIPEAEVFQFQPIEKIKPKAEREKEETQVGGMSGGGVININTGETIKGMGPDTQLIAAQPGEVVMSKKAVDAYGLNNLLAMNKSAGGTNTPTMGTLAIPGFSGGGVTLGLSGGGGIQGFSGGGVVEPVPKGSYKGQGGQKYGDPRDYGPHAGIDITEDVPYGPDPKIPVVSMAGGKVVASSPHYPYQTSGYTSNLTVNHGNGLMATYLHMTPAKKVGTAVKRGERIGKLIPLGTSSNNYAQTHLHLQTYKDGKVVNPLRVFDGTIKPGSGTNAGEVKSPPEEGAPVIQSAQVKPPSKTTPPISPPQSGGKTGVLPIPSSNQQRPQTSGVSAGQKDVPSFSSRDLGNTEFIVIKSIYNIVG